MTSRGRRQRCRSWDALSLPERIDVKSLLIRRRSSKSPRPADSAVSLDDGPHLIDENPSVDA